MSGAPVIEPLEGRSYLSADLVPAISGSLPPALVTGGKFKSNVVVTITNQGDAAYAGPATLDLLASTDQTPDAGDTPVSSISGNLKLKPGASKSFKVKSGTVPALADGDYFLLAQVTDSAGAVRSAGSTTSSHVAPAFVDLTGALPGPIPASLARGASATVAVTITNGGNVTAKGNANIGFRVSPSGTPSQSDQRLGSKSIGLSLAPGASKTFKLKFVVPSGLLTGTYFLVAEIDNLNAIAESDEGNNDAVSATTMTIT